MSEPRPGHVSLVLAACVAAVLLGGMAPARASIISPTPTLPLLGVPYASSVGVGCFPAAGVCVDPGTFVLTSVVTSMFNLAGQDIVANVDYFGTLTTLSHLPIGPVNLSGTMEQEVLGRTFSTETGTWPTEIVALSLSGPVLGHTLTLTQSASPPSVGSTSITPLSGEESLFRIDSFFDVFVDLTLDTPTPLHTTRGPVRLAAVPEPSSLALVAGGLVTLAAWRRRRATSR